MLSEVELPLAEAQRVETSLPPVLPDGAILGGIPLNLSAQLHSIRCVPEFCSLWSLAGFQPCENPHLLPYWTGCTQCCTGCAVHSRSDRRQLLTCPACFRRQSRARQ